MTPIRKVLDRASNAVGGPGRLIAILVGVALARGVLSGLHDPAQGFAGFGEWAGVIGAVGQRLVPPEAAPLRDRRPGWSCGLLAIVAALASLVATPLSGVATAACAGLSAVLGTLSIAHLTILVNRSDPSRTP